MGKDCRELVEELGIPIIPLSSCVTTASGQSHRILGKTTIYTGYKNMKKEITLFLCPGLEQRLYLGIDFWRMFGLAPDIIGVAEIDLEKVARDMNNNDSKYKLNPHDLNNDQRQRLDDVIEIFDTFEKKGLGCMPLEKHTIKLVEGAEPVKDRYYPISPAVQK